MTGMILYWGFGLSLVFAAYLSMNPRPELKGFKGFIATLFACLFWPVALITLWYEQQRQIWQQGPFQEKLWLKAREPGSAYTWGRLTVILRYPSRRLLRKTRHVTVYIRPRPALQPPLLFCPGAVQLNFLLCQFVLTRPDSHSSKSSSSSPSSPSSSQ